MCFPARRRLAPSTTRPASFSLSRPSSTGVEDRLLHPGHRRELRFPLGLLEPGQLPVLAAQVGQFLSGLLDPVLQLLLRDPADLVSGIDPVPEPGLEGGNGARSPAPGPASGHPARSVRAPRR